MLYTHILKPLLFRLDAEDAHHLTLRALSAAGRVPGAARVLRALYGVPRNAALESRLFGLTFPNPVGLAAGLDKDAQAVTAFTSVGFGFMEVGTVTPRPQAGNERPRLFRLPADTALINRMGFNNAGADAMAARLALLPARRVPVAVNIGKNKDTPNEQAADDYRACVRVLYPHADFFVVNVSSPNTPGLRSLQAGEDLRHLLTAVMDEVEAQRVRFVQPTRAVLVKIAPDLGDAALVETLNAALAAGVAGVIVSNTTLSREGLRHANREQAGGLSGQPLTARSTELIRRVYAHTGGRLPVVGSGGVFTAEDAYAKIRAGASLVEVYTGLIYHGPGIVRRINAGLVRLLRRDGFASVQDAVGADHAP